MQNYNNQRKSNNVSIDKNVKYINPYNFITLPENCERLPESERRGKLTGFIECELIAKTPIIVPNTNDIEEENLGGDKKFRKYKFFNYGEKSTENNFTIPVIPGSEIRGMLRSDYEVFTNSCMSTLNDDISFISRSKDIKMPGILEKDNNGKWHLYEAKRYAVNTCRRGKGKPKDASGQNCATYFVDENNGLKVGDKIYKTGDRVKFTFKPSNNPHLSPYVISIGSGNTEGILFVGELGGKKEVDKNGNNNIHDSIFVKQKVEVQISNIEESVKNLKEIFDMYNDKAFNQKIRGKNKVWYAGYDIAKLQVLPVWYSKPDTQNRRYLSLAAIGKEAYHRKLHELVGEFMPCIDKNNICNACNMFGFVSENDAISSKIRVSDAVYEAKENPYDKKMIIKELASPHIANAAFYALYAPNNQFQNLPQNFDFNYDVRITQNGKVDIKEGDISIRGRKMYWHHDDIQNSVTNEKTERNCEVTPVKVNTKFNFKIYFNNINEENLNELIAVINLKYDNKDLCHKIGKAKPLGFGSCKIDVQNVYIRNITENNGKIQYSIIDYDNFFNSSEMKLSNISLKMFNMDTIPMKEALRIYDFNYIKNNYKDALVQYPIGTKNGKEASMYWFMLNKSDKLGNPYILMVLPRIIDGKDENGVEGFKNSKIKENGRELGEISGLLLPKYIK